LEPALKVGAPHTVRFHRMLKWLRVGLCPATLPALHHQPRALHDLAHRARRRPTAPRLIPFQNPLQLPRSPAHVRLAQTKHGLFNRNRRLVGMPDSIPVQFNQTRKAMLPVTAQPAIATLARDPEVLTKLRHRSLIPLILKDKTRSFFHRTARFPRHASLQNIPTMPQCVNNAPGLFCQQSPRFIPPQTPTPSPVGGDLST